MSTVYNDHAKHKREPQNCDPRRYLLIQGTDARRTDDSVASRGILSTTAEQLFVWDIVRSSHRLTAIDTLDITQARNLCSQSRDAPQFSMTCLRPGHGQVLNTSSRGTPPRWTTL